MKIPETTKTALREAINEVTHLRLKVNVIEKQEYLNRVGRINSLLSSIKDELDELSGAKFTKNDADSSRGSPRNGPDAQDDDWADFKPKRKQNRS